MTRRFVTLEAIQETIKTLGLDDQIDASVFLNELEQQMMKLGNLMPPPPPADFNDMPKGEVRRVIASPEDIARRRRLRQLFADGLKDSLRDGASKPKLPPYPSNYEHTSVRQVQLSADEIARHRRIREDTKKAFNGRFPTPYTIGN